MVTSRGKSALLALPSNTLHLWWVFLLSVTLAHERSHPALALVVLAPLNHALFSLISSLRPGATLEPFSRTWFSRFAQVTAICLVASFAVVAWYGSYGRMVLDLKVFLKTPPSWILFGGLFVLTFFLYGPLKAVLQRFMHHTGLTDTGPWKAVAVGMVLWLWVDALFAALLQQVDLMLGQESFTQDISSYLNAFYFSTTTLATVGFGDIAPVSLLARAIVLVEVGVGIGLLGFILGRAVSYSHVRHE